MKLLENMRQYYQENSAQIDLTNGDILQSREEKRRAITDIGDRVTLFPEKLIVLWAIFKSLVA